MVIISFIWKIGTWKSVTANIHFQLDFSKQEEGPLKYVSVSYK